MTAYYNEIEPFAAQWLRNLIAAGHIAHGVVDERSIQDVEPESLGEFDQCHFFAGIGGWSLALRLAGWSDDRPVWTGSCPCQPFSAAGKGAGFADERHRWPLLHRLIDECRPSVVFGEQVASKDGLEWLDLVQADLETSGYANAAVDICAASVGAPHIRQRLWWVATVELGDTSRTGLPERQRAALVATGRRGEGRAVEQSGRAPDGMADAELNGGGREASSAHHGQQETDRPANQHGGYCGSLASGPGPTNGFWRDADWLLCRDGKWRPVEPGTSPLAHGVPGRVGQLRAYGNAIVPQVAAEVIGAFMECRP